MDEIYGNLMTCPPPRGARVGTLFLGQGPPVTLLCSTVTPSPIEAGAGAVLQRGGSHNPSPTTFGTPPLYLSFHMFAFSHDRLLLARTGVPRPGIRHSS